MAVQRENDEKQVKEIKDVPLFDGTKAEFPAWKKNYFSFARLHGMFGIVIDGVDVPVADETVPVRMYESNLLPGTLFAYDSKTILYARELTSVRMHYSKGDGVDTSLSRLMYCTHE